MIKIGARQNPKAFLRRPSTGNDQTRPRAALDSHRGVRSALRDAGSADRDSLTSLLTPSIASHAGVQCMSAIDRQRRNPHSV